MSLMRVGSGRRDGALLVKVAAGAALLGLAIANLVWLHGYRFGLPFNIDEAGYLQRSIQYQQAIDAGSVRQLIAHWQTPDIVAPVLPFLAGIVQSVLHLTPWGIVGVEQLFYLATVVGSYLLARRLLAWPWSLGAAALVAGLPGLIDSSHLYYLSSPATALFVLCLWGQSRAWDFLRLRRAVGWGVLLGIFCLTRSMVVAFIPAFVVVASGRALHSASRRTAVRNLVIGLVIGGFIAMSWYWTSWRTVYRYLTQYGYGSQANLYTGAPQQLSVVQRIHMRFMDVANQDVYLPLLLALVLSLLLCAVLWAWRARLRQSSHDGAQHERPGRLAAAYAHPLFDAAAVTVLVAVVLCTTSNSGSYFELPLVPVLIVIAVLPLVHLRRAARAIALTMLAGALILTFVDQFGFVPSLSRVSSVSVGGISVVAFNGEQADFVGQTLRELALGGVFWSNCGGATVSCFFGRTEHITRGYLESWTAVNQELERYVYSYGQAHGYSPVVFFAYQGPLLNTNTVGLAAQAAGRTLPIGALLPPPLRGGLSYRFQLDSPQLGQPNFVVAEGSPYALGGVAASAPSLARSVDAALRSDGFTAVKSIPLPSAAPLEIWWKDR